MASIVSFVFSFMYKQWFVTPAKPTQSFKGKTAIITGSNVGLGLEAARHIVSLQADRVILAVRTTSKGEVAKKDIEKSTQCPPGVVEVWPLDLSSYESVRSFAARAEQELPRLDFLLENAGISTQKFSLTEGTESTINTNVVSTFLLAFSLMPLLKRTAQQHHVRPTVTVVSSDLHYVAAFKEQQNAGSEKMALFNALNDEKLAQMGNRYSLSKLLDVYATRAMAAEAGSSSDTPVIINTVSPGFCHSELIREMDGGAVKIFKALFARTTEVGSRVLVSGATAGPESHGQYMENCRVHPAAKSVTSTEGQKTQKRFWEELCMKLESISPGIVSNL